MIRTSPLTAIDRDEPLELLAEDRQLAGAMTEACHAFGVLLAIEPALLAADDRAALVTHLTACARCRAVGVDVWLDGDVPPPETVVIARLPPVRQLARAPSRRRRQLVVASALAACLAGGAMVATQLGDGPSPAPLANPGSGSHTGAPGSGSQVSSGSGSQVSSGSGSQAPPARPWADGVSEEAQQAALVLFEQGNQLLRAGALADAAALYREALTHWDHPGLSFNLAVALAGADEPIEQYRALVKAQRYGVAPLDPEKFQRAQAMLVEVRARVARLDFTTQRPAAILIVDGVEVFTGPGRHEAVVLPGRHTWSVRVGPRALPPRTIDLAGGAAATLPDVDRELAP